MAAAGDRTDVIRYLVDRGADINAREVNQRTPLDDAVMHAAFEAEALLRSLGGTK